VVLRLRGGAAESVQQTVLTHEKLNAHNTFDQPDVVVPKTTAVDGRGPEVHCVLAPASVVRLDVKLG
jgi:alpha-L-arabinofuranosidase